MADKRKILLRMTIAQTGDDVGSDLEAKCFPCANVVKKQVIRASLNAIFDFSHRLGHWWISDLSDGELKMMRDAFEVELANRRLLADRTRA